jgi:hypothetical protein
MTFNKPKPKHGAGPWGGTKTKVRPQWGAVPTVGGSRSPYSRAAHNARQRYIEETSNRWRTSKGGTPR